MPGWPTLSFSRGFTLLELLTAVSAVSILIGLGLTAAEAVQHTSKRRQATAELAVLRQLLAVYRETHGEYPPVTVAETIPRPLVTRLPAWHRTTGADGQPVLVDPWGQGYRYYYRNRYSASAAASDYILYSCGPDGAHAAPAAGQIDLLHPDNIDNVYSNE